MIFDLFKNEEVKIELSSEDDYKILSDSIQEDYDIEKVKEKFHYILKEIERAQLEFDELILHITSNFEFLISKSRGCHSDPTAALGTKRITAGEKMLMLVILGAFLIGSFFWFIICACKLASNSDRYIERSNESNDKSL